MSSSRERKSLGVRCQVAFSACTSARGVQLGPTGALLGLSSTNSAKSGLCHYIALVQLSSLLFNDVLLKIFFKQYLGCLYIIKVPLVKLPSLMRWPESLQRSLKRKRGLSWILFLEVKTREASTRRERYIAYIKRHIWS